MKISRRKFLGLGVIAFTGLHLDLSAKLSSPLFSIDPNSDGTFDLPKLKYSYDALNHAIDSETMKIHHTKHHQAYIDKLNAGLDKAVDFKRKNLAYILQNIKNLPKELQSTFKNNGGGHYNHTFFWETLSPTKQQPGKKMSKAILKNFQSFDLFKKQFKEAALACFGSGWVWLLQKEDKSLIIKSFPNQDNFLMDTDLALSKPLLALDLWEHAYYLKYQNKRADYIDHYFEIINWTFVEYQLNSKK